jgi:hypothetical protein
MRSKVLLLLAAAMVVGCVSGPLDEQDQSTHERQTSGPREDGWRACLLDHPVCVQAVYCDEESATEWAVCRERADRSCHLYDVPAGEECFDGRIGRCDGAGHCK